MGDDSKKRDGFFFFILFIVILLVLLPLTCFGLISVDEQNWNDVDLSLPKFKYDSSTWRNGFAADCLDSSSNYACTSNLTSNGHPRNHIDSHKNLNDLIQDHENGLEISPCPLWISYENRNLSKNKGKNKYRKTGFDSRSDQDKVFEEIMLLNCGKEALLMLNSLAEQVRLKVSAALLSKNKNLPMCVYKKGEKEAATQTANSYVLILGHFADKSQREAGKIHVTTFYPQVEELKSGEDYELKVLDYGNISDKLKAFLIGLSAFLIGLTASMISRFENFSEKSPLAQVLEMAQNI